MDDNKKILNLLRKLYDFSCVGGNLHCHIDDANIELFDDDFNPFLPDASESQLEVEREIHAIMRSKGMEDRERILDAFFTNGGT